MKKYWKIGLIVLGAMLGYGYYYFIGCRSGVCPITSNPWVSTGYGALLGLVLTIGKSKKNNDDRTEEK
jgi:hypothetical protein